MDSKASGFDTSKEQPYTVQGKTVGAECQAILEKLSKDNPVDLPGLNEANKNDQSQKSNPGGGVLGEGTSKMKRSMSDNFDTNAEEMDKRETDLIAKLSKQFNIANS
jgi:hypothetical protein